MRLSSGSDNFKKIRTSGSYFVDKSLFIKDVVEDGAEVILLPRPRRFGKTINMSMLAAFLELDPEGVNKPLFDGLAISKDTDFCEKHQGQYPTIFISFKSAKQANYMDCMFEIARQVRALYKAHRALLDGDTLFPEEKDEFSQILKLSANDSVFKHSLASLSEYLYRHTGKPVYILIDEYDTPFQAGYLNGYYDEVKDFVGAILANALKGNHHLERGVLTGITRIAQAGIFSDLNNVEANTLLHKPYAQYFGFTEPEVEKLLQDLDSKVSLSALKHWYNGYTVGGFTLYNPWSITSCIKRDGSLEPYWINTSDNVLIESLISEAGEGVRVELEALLQSQTIQKMLSDNLTFSKLKTYDETTLWTLLVYAGYLTVSGDYQRAGESRTLSIPNREVEFIFSGLVKSWFTSGAASFSFYQRFLDSFAKGDFVAFEEMLSRYISQSASYFDFSTHSTEHVFHVFMLGLVAGLKEEYLIQSNRESGKGRFDMLFIPKDKNKNGMIMEFKLADSEDDLENSAKNAIEQIKDKNYKATLDQHGIKKQTAIGVAFFQKSVKVSARHLT